jgi:hypothetical protein
VALSPNGEQLRAELTAGEISTELQNQLKNKKAEILNALHRDKQSTVAGFLIGVPGELYFRTVSRYSTAYIERNGDVWQAWREMYQKGQTQAINTKAISESTKFNVVLTKAKHYFDFIERKRSEKHG